MHDVKVNTSKTLTLTLPSDADSNTVTVDLIHEFGDVVKSNTAATRSSTGVYTVTFGQEDSGIYVLQSAGKHRAVFTYSINGTEYSQSQYINVYTPYVESVDFFTNHPELEQTFVSQFDVYEKRARNIINTYCGQSFDSYPEKSITIDGNDHSNLHLPIAITRLAKVTMNYGDSDETVIHDINDPSLRNIEKVRQPFNFESSYFLRYKSTIVQTASDKIFGKKFNHQLTIIA